MKPSHTLFLKIISGGQTGVDRAALDVGSELGLSVGGWCPRERRAEGGSIPAHYPLRETPSRRLAQRTIWNIRDSDGTLVLTCGPATGGTALTIRTAQQRGKPCLVLNLLDRPNPQTASKWIQQHGIQTLNVAGPRASSNPAIYGLAKTFLREMLSTHLPDALEHDQ